MDGSKVIFIGAGSVAAGNWNIQQSQVNPQLCTVVNDLAKGHADHFALCGKT